MNHVLGTTVEVNIELHGLLLGCVLILSSFSVELSEDCELSVVNAEFDIWEDGVDEHGLSQLVTNNSVPFRNEIWISTLEHIGKWKTDFFKVSCHQDQENGSVEELSDEDTIGN